MWRVKDSFVREMAWHGRRRGVSCVLVHRWLLQRGKRSKESTPSCAACSCTLRSNVYRMGWKTCVEWWIRDEGKVGRDGVQGLRPKGRECRIMARQDASRLGPGDLPHAND